jgi:hypothetical protein
MCGNDGSSGFVFFNKSCKQVQNGTKSDQMHFNKQTKQKSQNLEEQGILADSLHCNVQKKIVNS